jgi:hypothetical protein
VTGKPEDIIAGQFLTAQSGIWILAQFWNGTPDWMNMTPDDIDQAVESLPNPLDGYILPIISLQEAMEVNDGIIYTIDITRSSH